uniref:Borealin C-terminal domain-containing protein n=1 Tax=Amblyomma aureolatum TaxID=187763 RepID=A0A1E1XDZ9_9ACAR
MPRTKKGLPRNSSLLPGTTLNPDSMRYLEVMVNELQCTMDSSIATAQAVVNQIHSQVDMWYDNIMRVVPEEILNRPYREFQNAGVLLPTLETTSLSALSAASGATETSADSKSSTCKQPRLKKVAASAKAKRAPSQRGSMVAGGKKKASDEPAGSKPRKMVRKASMHTPIMMQRTAGRLPVVTPKFDIRKRPATARKARQGETLLSLSGSPVNSKPVEAPIHVHINKGKVVKLMADASSSSSVQKLCKAIQSLCEK